MTVTKKGTKKILSDVICYVEVNCADGSSASSETIKILETLGASVEPSLRYGQTHLVWSNGNNKLVQAAECMDIKTVSPLWVQSCFEAGKVIDWTSFAVKSSNTVVSAGRPIVNMEPSVGIPKNIGLHHLDSPFLSSSQRETTTFKPGSKKISAAASKSKKTLKTVQENSSPIEVLESAQRSKLKNGNLDIPVKTIVIDKASAAALRGIEVELEQNSNQSLSEILKPVAVPLPNFRLIPSPERPIIPIIAVGSRSPRQPTLKRRFSERVSERDSDDDEADDMLLAPAKLTGTSEKANSSLNNNVPDISQQPTGRTTRSSPRAPSAPLVQNINQSITSGPDQSIVISRSKRLPEESPKLVTDSVKHKSSRGKSKSEVRVQSAESSPDLKLRNRTVAESPQLTSKNSSRQSSKYLIDQSGSELSRTTRRRTMSDELTAEKVVANNSHGDFQQASQMTDIGDVASKLVNLRTYSRKPTSPGAVVSPAPQFVSRGSRNTGLSPSLIDSVHEENNYLLQTVALKGTAQDPVKGSKTLGKKRPIDSDGGENEKKKSKIFDSSKSKINISMTEIASETKINSERKSIISKQHSFPVKKQKSSAKSGEDDLREADGKKADHDGSDQRISAIDESKWWSFRLASGNSSGQSSKNRLSGIKIALTGFEPDERTTLASIAANVESNYKPSVSKLKRIQTNNSEKGKLTKTKSSSHVAIESPCMLSSSEDLDVLYPCSIVVKAVTDIHSRSLRVIVALACNIPIVTEEWLYHCLERGAWLQPSADVMHPRFGKRLLYHQVLGRHEISSSSSKNNKNAVALYSSCGLLKSLSVYVKTDSKQAVDPPQEVLAGIAKLCGASSITSQLEDADVAILGANQLKIMKSAQAKRVKFILSPKDFFDAVESGQLPAANTVSTPVNISSAIHSNASSSITDQPKSSNKKSKEPAKVLSNDIMHRSQNKNSVGHNSNEIIKSPLQMDHNESLIAVQVNRSSKDSLKPAARGHIDSQQASQMTDIGDVASKLVSLRTYSRKPTSPGAVVSPAPQSVSRGSRNTGQSALSQESNKSRSKSYQSNSVQRSSRHVKTAASHEVSLQDVEEEIPWYEVQVNVDSGLSDTMTFQSSRRSSRGINQSLDTSFGNISSIPPGSPTGNIPFAESQSSPSW